MSSEHSKKARVAEIQHDQVNGIVVIGGGVAGVSCAKELARISSDNAITLISATETLVEVISYLIIILHILRDIFLHFFDTKSSFVLEVSERLKEVKVFEKLYDQFNFENPNVHIRIGAVTSIDFSGKQIFLSGIQYCI